MNFAIKALVPTRLGAITARTLDPTDGYRTTEQHFLRTLGQVGKPAGYPSLDAAITAGRDHSAGDNGAVAVSQKYGVHDRFMLRKVEALKLWQLEDTGAGHASERGKFNVDAGYTPYDFSAVAARTKSESGFTVTDGFQYPRYEFWGLVDGADTHRNPVYDPV